MAKKGRFPKQLLKEPPHVRLQYFLDLTVVHPRLDEVHQTLMRVIRRPFSGTLVFVSGPAGVGKTTLFRKVLTELDAAVLPDLEMDRVRVPVVCLEEPSSESSVVNRKPFYKLLLYALYDPSPSHKT